MPPSPAASLTSSMAPIATMCQRMVTPGSHLALVNEVLDAALQPAAAHVFTALLADQARAAARVADDLLLRNQPRPMLSGLPVTVKDLFDIEGRTTLAGSVARDGEAVATADALAVTRLRAAGAAIIGLTNMSEFAFTGAGLNPHNGTPRNPCDAQVTRIPGGSSSGAAVSVALGLAVAALGSDTGGSIRIPAALCGLVGFKNTQRRTPLRGAFPLSFTLDTVCAMTRTVQDCVLVDAVLSGQPLTIKPRTVANLRLALPQTLVLDNMAAPVAAAFSRTLDRLSAAGAKIVPVPLRELAEIAEINSPASFAAIEAFAVHRELMRTRREQLDPRVAMRIAAGENVSAADYITMCQRRQNWIDRVEHGLRDFDAIICPTVPIIAPALNELLHNDSAFFAANALLLRNPATINFLDGCAFSLPCQAEGELPVGLMLAAPAGQDAALAIIALAVQNLLAAQ